MKYACWFPSPSMCYPLVESEPGYLSNSTICTVVADSAEDAAKAFLSAHGKSAGDVEVCWSFTIETTDVGEAAPSYGVVTAVFGDGDVRTYRDKELEYA